MRLIDTTTGVMEEFIGRDIPRYAILSHTWNSPEEVTYQEYIAGRFEHKKGFEKIRKTCELAKGDGLGYAWIDTCCIDKSSSAELSEAINSMYRWYERSEVCYAYLSDLLPGDNLDALGQCLWFTRGWTLQELIAPTKLLFYDSAWKIRSTKNWSAAQLSSITNIESRLLLRQSSLSDFSVAQKMSWAARRKTTRVEDEAYCLLGIFDLNMPLLYGEEGKAFRRLQEEIIRSTADLSIFAWTLPPSDHHSLSAVSSSILNFTQRSLNHDEQMLCGVLSESPAEFFGCQDAAYHLVDLHELSTSNIGIKTRVRMSLRPIVPHGYGYLLPVAGSYNGMCLAIFLRQIRPGRYLRENPWKLFSYSSLQLLHTPPIERLLLTRVPEERFGQPTRLRPTGAVLSERRSYALQITTSPGITTTGAWPLGWYDHEDQIFISPTMGRDFGFIKVLLRTSIYQPDGLCEVVTVGNRFCSLGWQSLDPLQAQFSIISEEVYGGALDNIQRSASEGDWNAGQLQSELCRHGISKSRLVRCDHSSGAIIIVSFSAHVIEGSGIAWSNMWKIQLSYETYTGNRRYDAPFPIEESWNPYP